MKKPPFASTSDFVNYSCSYLDTLRASFNQQNLSLIQQLAEDLKIAWLNNQFVYVCGNGGSAANAIHIANDFLYGVGACGTGPSLPGIKVEALSSNGAIITCLANDTSYDNVFAHQLQVKAAPSDILLVLSGSGNSPNIIRALEVASTKQMKSYAILGFTGGRSLDLADVPIHFDVHDMQIAEDIQLIAGHLCMKWLTNNKPCGSLI